MCSSRENDKARCPGLLRIKDMEAVSGPSRLTLILCGLAALLLFAIFLPFDAEVSRYATTNAPHRSAVRIMMNVAGFAFGWPVYVVLGGLVMLRYDRIRVFPSYLGLVLGCIGTMHLTKFIIGRARPELELGAYHVAFFGNPSDKFDSFPSGHATNIVLISLLCWLYFPKSRWIVAPLAVLACAQRVVTMRHFPTDVVAGACFAAIWVFGMRAILGRSAFPRLSPLKLTKELKLRQRTDSIPENA